MSSASETPGVIDADAPVADVVAAIERRARSQARGTEAILTAFHEESALGKAYDARLVLRIAAYLRPYRRSVYLALGAMVVTAVAALLRPLVMRHTVDHIQTQLVAGVVAYFTFLLIEQGLTFLQIWVAQVAGARAMNDLRLEVFAFLQKLRVGYFDTQPVGRLVTRATNDVDAVLELFASGALNIVGDLVRLVGIIALMLVLDWRLALMGFASAPFVLLLVSLVRRRSRDAYREIRAKTSRMNANMDEQVTGMPVVQAFRRERQAAREFDAISGAYRDANIASIKWEAIQDAAIDMVQALCLATILYSLGWRQVSFGTLVAFNAYLVQFFEPISMLAQRYTLLQSAMAGAERVFGLLDTQAEDAPVAANPAPDGDASLAFELEHVDFEYKPGVAVLRDVSLSARPGEKIALVGATGAGKTTISAVLLRLYEISAGVVRVRGKDVRGMTREALRRQFAVVPQDVYLFPGTVASNVASGEVADPERVRRALERVGALELFERRELGIDAPVGEHGANFSAGERQLIAFARATYRDAPILVLDEATASVDSDTEARLQRALAELLVGRTALIIAHRLSTIRAADRIVVFHKGRVAEQGSHDELIARRGLYARLYELQYARAAE